MKTDVVILINYSQVLRPFFNFMFPKLNENFIQVSNTEYLPQTIDVYQEKIIIKSKI